MLLEPENQIIGTVNEDFAVESLAGDIFQLGNAAYRIRRVERGTVRVEDAEGMAPNIPFWLGEAPGRTDELSGSVSRLRGEFAERLAADPLAWLVGEIGIAEPAAEQIIEYLASGRAALGVLPTLETVVIERFFDEAGGMQLVIHSPYGSRLNRAWGLALRKRFCRKFNFELQAAATEDNIVLSLTKAHSFDLAEIPRYLHSNSIRRLLIEALLDAPMFITRWRWVAGVSLALPRFRGGKKVPPQLARMAAEDLIAAIFPDQVACAENLVGEREIPEHPLIRQTIVDCLGDAMDLAGLERLLKKLEAGEVRVVTRDLTEPSPLALEVLSARPYAYLDDAPLEERRTQAVMSRRWLGPEAAGDIGRLDVEAIARVQGEAWPDPANADELHDALVWLGFMSAEEAQRATGWGEWLAELARDKRASLLFPSSRRHPAEAGGQGQVGYSRFRGNAGEDNGPDARHYGSPPSGCRSCRRCGLRRGWTRRSLRPQPYAEREWSREEALVEILRGRLEGLGPVTENALAAPLGVEPTEIAAALTALETEGFAMRGRFSPDAAAEEWCDRRLLARIHRYTVGRLRAEIQPVAARDFLRFLFDWQRVAPDARMEGPDALEVLVRQLEGFEAAAGAWETEILPARLDGYEPSWLDDQCLAGRIAWARLRPRNARANGSPAPVRTHADHPVGAPQCRALGVAVLDRGPAPAGPARPAGARLHQAIRRLVFRRAGRGQRPLAPAGRGGACRAGGFGARQLRQLRRAARTARAIRPARDAARVADGARRFSRWKRPGAGRSPAAPRRSARRGPRRSSISPAPCCCATGSCSGACSNAKHRGCRHGATCCGSTAGSRRAARSAAAGLSRVSRASSSRCPMRSECCAKRAASRPRKPGSRFPAPTRSISPAS